MVEVVSLILQVVFEFLIFGDDLRGNPHDRMHPRYGLPRERVRA